MIATRISETAAIHSLLLARSRLGFHPANLHIHRNRRKADGGNTSPFSVSGEDERLKTAYHICRILLGAWFLFSGLWHFFWPWLQPMGNQPAAIAFTKAMLASGLFDWVKAIEVTTGITMLLNRAMPLTIIAIVPLNIVIVYWNFVLDSGTIEWSFGAFTILANAVLAWPWRLYFWQMFIWRGSADFSLEAKIS
jgi:hypothetical protein